MKQAPSSAQWAQYGVNAVNMKNVLAWNLYDIQTYPTAGATSFTFFQTPNGSGGKTLTDTNMTNAGVLPAPQSFWLDSVEVEVWPGVDLSTYADAAANEFVNDVWNILKDGYLTLTIGSSPYIQEGPLERFPSSTRFGLAAAAASDAASTGTSLSTIAYATSVGKPFELVPLVIPAQQNFSVSINFDSLVTVTTAARIGVRLCGFLNRPVQ